MAVARVSQQSASSVYSTSLSHVVPVGASVAYGVVHQINATMNAAPTLGGVAMELVGQSGTYAYGQRNTSLWRLVNPAPGTSVFVPGGSGMRGFAIACYSGVDTADPDGTPVTSSATDLNTDPSATVSSATDDMVLFAIGFGQSGGTLTAIAGGGGATLATSILQDNVGAALLEEAGASSVTLGADLTFSSLQHSGWIAINIRASGGSTVTATGAGVFHLQGSAALIVQPVTTTPTADVLARVEVWNDYECALGLAGRLAVIPGIVKATRKRVHQDIGTLELLIPLDSPGANFLREERVIRTVYTDDGFDEWRIKEIDDVHTEDGLLLQVACVDPGQDLATKAVIERTEADGSAARQFELLSLTPTEHLQATVLPALQFAGAGYWGIGTVEATAPVDLVYDDSNPLEMLRRLAQQCGMEWRTRRVGTTGYVIDLLIQIGSTYNVAQVRVGANARGVKRHHSSTEQMTRGYPSGMGVESRNSTMARNRWQVTGINGLVVTLADPLGGEGPVAFDNQYVPWGPGVPPMALRVPGGAPTVISASVASAQTVTVASTAGLAQGTLVEFCLLTGADLTFLDAPAEAATFGILARPIARPDIPGTVNLISNPAMRVWSGGASSPPDGWAIVTAPGLTAPTLTRTTTPGLQRFAGKSCRIQGTGDGTGLRTPVMTLGPTAAKPYGIGYVSAWLAAGRARAELVVRKAQVSVTISRSGQIASVGFSADHGLRVGDRVELSGANQVEYNDIFTVQTMPSSTSCTVIVTGSPASPATGTPLAAQTWIIPDGTNGKALIQQVNAWADIWVTDQRVDFHALGVVAGYIRIVQDGATALDLYWDAAQLTQANVQEPFVEGSGPTQMMQETNRQLRLLAQPLARYDVDVVNLAAADQTQWARYAFATGQVAAITDPDLHLSGQTRVLQLEEELVELGNLRIVLSSRPEDVTDLIVRPPRPDRLPRGITTATEFSLQIKFEDIATNPGAVGVRLSARPANGRIKYQVLDKGAAIPVIGATSYLDYTAPFVVNQDQPEDLVIAAYVEDGTRVSSIQTWDVDRDNVPEVTVTLNEIVAGTLGVSWVPDDDVEKVRLYYRLDASNWPTLNGASDGILDQTYYVGEINVREDGGSVARDGTPLADVYDSTGTARTGIGGTAWRKTGLSAANVTRVIVIPVDRRGNLGARVAVTRTIAGTVSAGLTAFAQSALTNSVGSAPTAGQRIYGNLTWTPNASVVDATHDLEIAYTVDGVTWEVLTTVASPLTTTSLRVNTGYVYGTGKHDPYRLFTFRARLLDPAVVQTRVSNQQEIQTRDAPL